MLDVRNLSIAFGVATKPTVSDVSFNLGHGKTLGIVGESGSGKSTIAWSLLGLLPQQARITSGSVHFDGRELLALKPDERHALRGQGIAMVFQDPFTSLNPCLTIGKQLTEVLVERSRMTQRSARAEAVRMLNEVQLPRAQALLSSFPHELSGGMRQRIVIAMALACSPRLLILDEPTTALDVTVEAHILKLLQALQAERNLSMLFISHNLGIVEQMCSDIVVMERGLVVESGDAQRILRMPSHPYTKRLLASLPRLKAQQDNALEEDEIQSSEVGSFVVDAKNLSLQFGAGRRGLLSRLLKLPDNSVAALQNVSIRLGRGEIVGLVGESGSGKSTLGRCIVGIHKPQNGEIRFSHAEHNRNTVQMVFQNPDSSLNPRHTVGAMIGRSLKMSGISSSDLDKKVAELLELVRLPSNYGNRYPHQLSGGEKQRVGIARALAMRPTVLICDEITSALDVSIQAAILDLIKDLRDRLGVSIIFISHDLAVVSQLCDRIVVMKQGEVVESAEAAEVIYAPKADYTRKLIDAIPPFVRATTLP